MVDLTGKKFGEFTVIRLHKHYDYGLWTWECRCNSCGGIKIFKTYELKHRPQHEPRICPAKRGLVTKPDEKDYTKIVGCKHNCRYWRNIDSTLGVKFCHYCIDNHARRPRNEDGSCAGYDETQYVRTQVPLVLGELS